MLVTPSVKLVAPLGAGGMGAVWLAEHTGLRTKVVVKFMHDELDGSDSARSRFSREATAAAQVKSPHVVQMLDHGVADDGAPFIVMEYLEGRNLGEILREKGALPPGEVVAIVTQIARALSRVHAAELLHRDVKPENIFLCDGDSETFVKLLDFGVVKSSGDALDTQTKTGQVVGTPFYMSPEQMMGQKEIDARSDLWSLGVVAYECLTGKRPFDGPSFGAVAVNIATGAPMPPSEASPAIPVAVDAWFQRACARRPEDRFATAKDLADGLREAFGGAISAPVSSVAVTFDESKPERALAPTIAEGVVAPSAREAIGLAKTEFGIEGGLSKSARPSSKAGVFVAAISLVIGAGGAVVFFANRSAEAGRAPIARGASSSTARKTSSSTPSPKDPSERRASSESKAKPPSEERAPTATPVERSLPSREAPSANAADLADATPALGGGELSATSSAAQAQDAGAAPSVPSAAARGTESSPSSEGGAETTELPEAPETRRDAATKTW